MPTTHKQIHEAFATIQAAVKNDPDYRGLWELTIAMSIYESAHDLIGIDLANALSREVCSRFFEGTNVFSLEKQFKPKQQAIKYTSKDIHSNTEIETLQSTIKDIVEANQGLKETELALSVILKLQKSNFTAAIILQTIAKMVERNELVKIAYVLPNNQIKAFYLPKNTLCKNEGQNEQDKQDTSEARDKVNLETTQRSDLNLSQSD